MTALTGSTIASTYKDLLQISNNNGGIDTTMRPVSDGEGTNSALEINNAAVNINGTFQLNGISLTKSATEINNMAGIGSATGIIAAASGNVYGRTLIGGTPVSITNANGAAGNPTITLASIANVSGSYGPFTKFAVNDYGQIVSATDTEVSVSIATLRTSEVITETVCATSYVNIGGDTSIAGALIVNGIVSANNNFFIGGKLIAATEVSVVNQLNTSNLYAASAIIDDLTANNLIFTSISVSSLIGNQVTIVSAATLAGVDLGTKIAALATSIGNSNTNITAVSAALATSIGNSNTNITTNINAITSINNVIGSGSGFVTDAELAAVSTALATSIGNSNTNITTNINAITSINSILGNGTGFATDSELAAVSVALATSIGNSNTNITTNINAITSINSVIGDGSGFATDAELAAVSATMATSISRHLPLAGGALTGVLSTSSNIELGNADTTLARQSAGDMSIEGNIVYRAGGTDVPVTDGGTGVSSLTDGGLLLGSGSGAITAMAVLSDGQMIVGDGSGDPVAESGATLRSSIGVDAAGTDNSTNVTLAGSLDYLTLSGQEITRGAIVLTTDITGNLPVGNLNAGTGASSSSFWRGDGVWATPSGSGDVVGPASSTDNAIVRFDSTTGKLLQNSTVIISDAGAITAASLTLTTDLAVTQGGTGVSTLTDGGVLLGSGTGAITAMAVLTDGQMIVGDGTGDPVAESGATLRSSIGVDAAGTDNSTNVTLAGTPDYITISGQTITRGAVVLTTDISGTLPIANGGTNATSAGAALTALGAAARGANSDITSITGLTTDLTVAQGGTGAGTFAANGILYGAGTGAIAATAVGTDGHVLTSNGSGVAPTFQAGGSGGASDINDLSDALTNSSGATIGLGTGALAADDGSANNNTALGYQALNDATTAAFNVAVGYQAMDSMTTGTGSSTAVGYQALSGVTTGYGNTGVGYSALTTITTTNHNTALGRYAGNGSTGTGSVMVGTMAGNKGGTGTTALGYDTLSSGSLNAAYLTAVGSAALKNNTTGTNNAALGTDSLLDNTTGAGNTGVGMNAGIRISTGSNNTFLGFNAGKLNTTGDSNTYIGNLAGNTTTTGDNNTLLGYDAEASSATVSNEITLGNASVDKFRIPGINFVIKDSTATDNYVLTVDSSGEAGWEAAAGGGGASNINGLSDALTNSSGQTIGLGTAALASDDGSTNRNTALGYYALNAVTSGYYNTAVGWGTGLNMTTGHNNVLVGNDAGYNITTGNSNIPVGQSASHSLTTGSFNISIGHEAGFLNVTANRNTNIGDGAGYKTTAANCVAVGSNANYGGQGTYNTTVGAYAMFSTGSKHTNTAIGGRALYGATTATYNTALGYDAGNTTTTGANNTLLGYDAEASGATVSNEITLGNGSISSLRCQVQTISSLSDRRDKKDIEELPLGIDFINTLKPVKFTWNMRDGVKIGQQEAGFIAQDLDEAQIDAGAEDYLSLVLKNNPEKLEASYGKLVPVLVKAVQDLSNEIKQLKKEIKNGR